MVSPSADSSKFCELDSSVLKLPRLGLILRVFRCINRKVSLNSKKSSLLDDIPSLPMGSLCQVMQGTKYL